MKFGSRLLKSIFACTLVLGLMPTLSFAEESVRDTTANTNSAAEEPVRSFAAEDGAEDATDVAPEDVDEGGIQPFSGVQDDVEIIGAGDFGEGNALHWAYRNDASLTISGEGAMPDYTAEGGQPWAIYHLRTESLVVEEGVTRLGSYSFYRATYLYEISLPDSLETIGEYVFDHCTALGSKSDSCVVIPENVREIGAYTFNWCENMHTCILPENLESISDGLFFRCSDLGNFVFPVHLKAIGTSSFEDCYDIYREGGIPESVETIGSNAFKNTRWYTDLYIPGAVKSIGKGAFSYIAFENEDAKLILGEGLTNDKLKGVFTTTGLVYTVVIPSTVTEYDSSVLTHAFTAFEVSPDNEKLASLDGVLYGCKSPSGTTYADKFSVLLKMPRVKKGDYAVPEGVKEIPANTICEYVTTLTLPATLEKFGDNFTTISDIEAIYVAEDNVRYSSFDGILFSKDGKQLIRFPVRKSTGFNYEIPNHTESLAAKAFAYSPRLFGVKIPPSVTEIPSGCFAGCTLLTSIYIPKSVSRFGSNCVAESTVSRGGVTVMYEGAQDEWSKLNLSSNEGLRNAKKYMDCKDGGVTKDRLIYVVGHDGKLTIARDVMASTPPVTMNDYEVGDQEWHSWMGEIKSIEVDEYINRIGGNAFNGCYSLESVTLPFEIEQVGGNAFANCENLVAVECLGKPFAVYSLDSPDHSFDANACIQYKANYASDWENDAGYDQTAMTWYGYALKQDGSLDLPVLSRLELSRTQVRAKGSDQNYRDAEIVSNYVAYDAMGNDITDYVSIDVSMPERTKGKLTTIAYVWDAALRVNLEEKDREIHFPRCGVEGEYIVTATPDESKVSGSAMSQSVALTREPERLRSYSLYSLSAYGSVYPGEIQKNNFDVLNQYYETVLDRVSFTVNDKSTGKDVTSCTSDYGFTINAGDYAVYYDPYAYQREFALSINSAASDLEGSLEGTIKIARSGRVFNEPYSIELKGGEDEIEIAHTGQWMPTPYRVKVLDAYRDPCWPELGWRIVDAAGDDQTEHFLIDEQGYLQVDEFIYNSLTLAGITYSIQASSTGIVCTGADYPSTGFYPYFANREIFSNQLSFTLKAERPSAPVTHTATFKVGDEVIGTVVFEEGDTSLVEPALPSKENYIGEWEDYDLASKTSDFVVKGVYAPMDPNKVSDVGGSADAEYENGLVTINLAASSATKNIKIESTSTKPVDVVMVLDRSGSMNDDGKLGKLKQCATEFAQKLYENAAKTGADHRIALAGFARGASSSGGKIPYLNTSLMVTANGGEKGYAELCKRGCSDALLSINDNGAVNSRIIDAISGMTAQGATAADLGLDIARRVFADNPVKTDANGSARERIVLFITDGTPTSSTDTSYSDVTTTAANAITMAKTIKSSQGACIYSVGVDPNASASAAFNSASDGAIMKKNSKTVIDGYDFNRFLHAVSSNYPNATGMANLGTGDKAAGYYMAANNTGSLDGIFNTILYSSVYKPQAFDRATLSYSLPTGLVLTMKNEESMRAALALRGIDPEDIEVIRESDSTRIVFHNIPVSREVVNGVSQYVARVSFQVSVDKDVSGSIQVGQDATIEVGGQTSDLEAPTVQIPSDRRLVVFKINGEIYEIRDAEVGDTITIPDTDIARWLELEKQQSPTVKEGDTYVVFETSTLDRSYTMKWMVNGISTTETHSFGDDLSIPSGIEAAVPEGMEISHWSPSLPQTMPARNVTCTAVLTPIHSHTYTAASYQSGGCDEGIVVHEVCACGEEREMRQEPQAHAYQAILSSAGQYQTTVEKLVCDYCGNAVNKNITYKVSKSSMWGNLTVLELDKVENEVIQSGPSSDDISIRFYVGTAKNGIYKVYRMEESGVQQTYYATVVDGYLTFDPDHFSIYVADEPIAEGEEPPIEPTFDQVRYVMENAEQPEELAGNEGPNGDDGSSTNPGDNNDNANDDSHPNAGNQGSDNSADNAGSGSGAGSSIGNGIDSGSGAVANDNGITSGTVPIEGAPQRNNTNVGSVSSEGAPLAQTGDKMLPWVVGGGSIAIMALTAVQIIYIRRRRDRAA